MGLKYLFHSFYRSNHLRQAYSALGKSMAHRGFIPDTKLIFHMTHHEIAQLLQTRSPVIIQKAMRRRRLRNNQWMEMKFKEVMQGKPSPIVAKTDSSNLGMSDQVQLKGTPASQGRYKGICRVVKHLSEAKRIQAGDILVTSATDIGWSPYFPLLGGVVTELGGLISHGAVVAREYGLPCIVGASNATETIKDGSLMIIDGAKGTLNTTGKDEQ